jgi:hypothetical protein
MLILLSEGQNTFIGGESCVDAICVDVICVDAIYDDAICDDAIYA